VPLVGVDDALDERMTNHVLLLEADQGNALDTLEGRLGLESGTDRR